MIFRRREKLVKCVFNFIAFVCIIWKEEKIKVIGKRDIILNFTCVQVLEGQRGDNVIQNFSYRSFCLT